MLVLTLLAGINNPKSNYLQANAAGQPEMSLAAPAFSDTEQVASANANTEQIASDSAKTPVAAKDPAPATPTETSTSKATTSKTTTSKTTTSTKAATAPAAKRAATTPTPSRSQPAASVSSSKASSVIASAKKYLGVKYTWGGTTPSGFDCSGFTQYVFAQNGVTLPRISRDQYTVGKSVDFASLQPADLVFFSMDRDKVVDHVGIYIGGGQFIQASSSKGVVITTMSSYWQAKYIGAKRVL